MIKLLTIKEHNKKFNKNFKLYFLLNQPRIVQLFVMVTIIIIIVTFTLPGQ